MLLLVDNLEQVIDSAPELGSLLAACPNLTLLITSRELLRIQGEVEYQVPPLAEPEAVSLFCERSGLEPSEDIFELCARLDSLPLAVELAAARTKALTPAQILERLSQRLDLLKGGRDADPRQQTLRATIEWSYDLLLPDEQELFARLSVFAGGCTLEAAEEIADADLDTIQSLVEKSLLRFTIERYWMLETIREYAGERLPTEDGPRRAFAHARYFLQLAELSEPELWAQRTDVWLPRLDSEQANLRAALAWNVDEAGMGCPTVGCAVSVLGDPRPTEGSAALARALARTRNAVAPELRAKALIAAGRVAGWDSDWPDRARCSRKRSSYVVDSETRRASAAVSDSSAIPASSKATLRERPRRWTRASSSPGGRTIVRASRGRSATRRGRPSKNETSIVRVGCGRKAPRSPDDRNEAVRSALRRPHRLCGRSRRQFRPGTPPPRGEPHPVRGARADHLDPGRATLHRSGRAARAGTPTSPGSNFARALQRGREDAPQFHLVYWLEELAAVAGRRASQRGRPSSGQRRMRTSSASEWPSSKRAARSASVTERSPTTSRTTRGRNSRAWPRHDAGTGCHLRIGGRAHADMSRSVAQPRAR